MGRPEKRTQADVAADRKKQILKAAVEVFAERGFHRTRVSDIAKQAGVAYGLIYHYFDSKDDVLNSVFDENWSVFMKVLQDLRDNPDMAAADKLSSVSALLIDALEVAPSIIQVIIQEISRSDRFVHSEKITAFTDAFGVVHAIIEQGQQSGELDATLDPLVGAYTFFGALETVCTGFMLGAIQCNTKEETERVKHTVNRIMLNGMIKDPAK
ncbi:MAG: helix-turn-helix domain-containing protein [Deltaproteobacteria bacterium]|jgi:TetR/AcrR family fatty acid metabolism transcriptional regulator